MDSLDENVRLFVFRHAADTGRVPTLAQIAEALRQAGGAVGESLKRLQAEHILVLAPGTTNIWLADPFADVPTSFKVKARGRTYWAICIWDALGIPATLHADATISTSCGDCGEPMTLEVRGDALVRSEGIIHFGVQARNWWENIGFT